MYDDVNFEVNVAVIFGVNLSAILGVNCQLILVIFEVHFAINIGVILP